MSFGNPAALWGLLSLVLLVLFSLFKQAAGRTVVPSLLLWKKIPERNPPLRALRRPAWRLELLLQALAIVSAVGALAHPERTTDRPKPRKVALVFDTSARLKASGRLEAAKAEAARLLRGPLSGDEVSLFAAVPAPRRLASLDEVRGLDAHVDLGPLLEAARSSTDQVILFGDRPVEGVHSVLFGAPATNAGIVEFTVTETEAFVRIVNHGPPRSAKIRLEWAGGKIEETLADLPPERGWFRKGDFGKADEVRVTLDLDDGFPLDNSVRATRLGASRIPVVVSGTGMPLLERALGAMGGVLVSHDGAGGLLSIGVDARPAPGAGLSVWLHSPKDRWEPRSWAPHPHPLVAGLRDDELGRGGVGEVPPEVRSGEPLLVADGKPIAVLKDGILHLALELDPRGWPLTPSFPIFWKNVVDFASKGGSAFAIVRTGVPEVLPQEASEIVSAPPGALFSLSPSGRFLAFTGGAYQVRTASGVRTVEANLLDERESDTAGRSRALDWNPASPGEREWVRQNLSGWAAGLSLFLLALAWILERRRE